MDSVTISKSKANSKKLIFIFSAPSGCGKTSLAQALIVKRDDLSLSVSHTTRAIRPAEVDGQDYYFVAKQQFETMIEEGQFLEHAKVFDNLYGTAKSETDRLNKAGKHVILDIDWQGARQVRERALDVISIFIMPPSLESLEKRLKARGQDSQSVIDRRMQDAKNEMSHKHEYDHIIVNDDFEHSLIEIEALFDQV
ncbi:MAG: guanylate kinase [Saprospiraceae bacterium]|jgi:guanylate kinase